MAEYDVARVYQVLVLPQSRKAPTVATEQLERELAALRRECASLRELHAAAEERDTASLH